MGITHDSRQFDSRRCLLNLVVAACGTRSPHQNGFESVRAPELTRQDKWEFQTGPIGLLTGKKAYVLAARGGLYAPTPEDSETVYVRDFLGFLGITDVDFLYVEGLALGEESRTAVLGQAHQELAKLAAFGSPKVAGESDERAAA